MKNVILLSILTITLTTFGQPPAEPCKSTHWNDWFMPGGGFKTYVPKNSDFGVYHGLNTEFVIYARAKNKCSNYGGPARTKFFSSLSIMSSTNS